MLRALCLMALLAPVIPQPYVVDLKKYNFSSSAIQVVSNKQKNSKQPKSDALLNQIYDSLNKKHSHDTLLTPVFSNITGNDTYITADTGSTVHLKCEVKSSNDKVVSWIKYTGDNFEILTLKMGTHSSDSRFRVDLRNDEWQLTLRGARLQDSGVYACQVSTNPPMLLRYYVTIREPFMNMTNEVFLETKEKLVLTCRVMNVIPRAAARLRWYRDSSAVPIDEIRGSVFVETDYFSLTTQLQVADLKMEDAGNYTCALEAPLRLKTVARVHVLQGSSLAELQSGGKTTTSYMDLMFTSVLVASMYGTLR